jgi:nucleoside-diphosphate-sugar epimerase
MKVLFIGGTGIISTASSRLAVEQGLELYVLNRGQSTRPLPAGVHQLRGDIRDFASAQAALGDLSFDVVINWVAFLPEHIESDLRLFRGRTGQYIFISSASAYQTPPASLPVTEETPLENPYWDYARNKIACEERLRRAHREEKFPATIVRPSHTYDPSYIPLRGGYTVIDRLRRGQKVIVPGDGTSLWVLTHNRDFAKGILGLFGNAGAIDEAYHITSDELLTWNQIYQALARAAAPSTSASTSSASAYASRAEPHLVHVPSELIAAYNPSWGASLLGDKSNSMIFDNTKIKRVVPGFAATTPFALGAQEIIAWHDADPSRRVVDEAFNQLTEQILTAYEKAWPGH